MYSWVHLGLDLELLVRKFFERSSLVWRSCHHAASHSRRSGYGKSLSTSWLMSSFTWVWYPVDGFHFRANDLNW